ncbi:protein scarlet-like [Macrosteles quadrilineatus]|uniref:protein scarlet-like n=1 Tax=Macrosteles quadrilineatus TaxID=74068 RepID=UPI0023E0D9CE|nr:protein scarlet-like [Macrosteles quadrilineatus]
MGDDLVLSWDIQDLTVTTTTRSFLGPDTVRHHTLLNNVRGYAKSGTLLAIMGPSGAGKTTLLAALSQRTTGNMSGNVLLNGRAVDRVLMVKISGFVPQQDLALSCLTVMEHLTFMASLKLDQRVSGSHQQRIIFKLINDLNLASCSYTQISALSGGERKRLSLAAQMLTDPPLLFCDEPTTGLDSYNASSVVNVLQTLTSRGKTVICTVHQPSSEVYATFHKVCLLLPGGSLAYFGDVANTQEYFQSLGMVCPPLYNPADFYLDKLNASPEVTKDLSQRFSASSLHEELVKELEVIRASSNKTLSIFGMDEQFLKFYSVQQPKQITQFQWLLWRSTLGMIRNRQQLLLRFILYMMVGLLVCLPYMSVQLDQAGIQSLQGFHYSIITETIFCQTYSILHCFPSEIAVMLREINNGVYQPGPYYLSKAVVVLPRVILETFMFCLIAFMTVGVEGGSLGFLLFCSPTIASAITSTAYGCCMSALFENVSSASLLTVPFDIISISFSGIFLHISTVPIYLKWVKYISRFYYGIEALSILQWRFIDDIPCSETPGIPCISTGEGVLTKYGFHEYNLSIDFVGLFITFVILHLVGFYAIKRRSKQQSVY